MEAAARYAIEKSALHRTGVAIRLPKSRILLDY